MDAGTQKLLLDALVAGNVDTYSDLFYLSTRPRISRDDLGDSQSFVEKVRDALSTAEHARHVGDVKAVLEANSVVGRMYSEAGIHNLALFFHDKCCGE
jgi:hypothetical protein